MLLRWRLIPHCFFVKSLLSPTSSIDTAIRTVYGVLLFSLSMQFTLASLSSSSLHLMPFLIHPANSCWACRLPIDLILSKSDIRSSFIRSTFPSRFKIFVFTLSLVFSFALVLRLATSFLYQIWSLRTSSVSLWHHFSSIQYKPYTQNYTFDITHLRNYSNCFQYLVSLVIFTSSCRPPSHLNKCLQTLERSQPLWTLHLL